MPLVERARRFLDERGAHYEVLAHREAFTAQGVAAAAHVSGWRMAKVLLVRGDRGPMMAVLPAARQVDLAALAHLADERKLSLVPEPEMRSVCPDCEPGAAPPLGEAWGLPVYLDSCFPRAREILFQAGNHHEVVRMAYAELERVAHPVVGEFCRH
jgi:Ala-tRNA(Pro) deacylase